MKILIAVEDKVFGEALSEFVINHQWPESTEFKVVHIVEPLYIEHYMDGYSYDLLPSLVEERHRRGRSLVIAVGMKLKEAFPAATVDEVILDGSPKEQILKLSSDWPADLIVVGSHGRRGLSQFFLGSVSMAVLSHSPCSVMIVRLPKEVQEKMAAAAAQESSEKEPTPASPR